MVLSPSVFVACSGKAEGPIPKLWVKPGENGLWTRSHALWQGGVGAGLRRDLDQWVRVPYLERG